MSKLFDRDTKAGRMNYEHHAQERKAASEKNKDTRVSEFWSNGQKVIVTRRKVELTYSNSIPRSSIG